MHVDVKVIAGQQMVLLCGGSVVCMQMNAMKQAGAYTYTSLGTILFPALFDNSSEQQCCLPRSLSSRLVVWASMFLFPTIDSIRYRRTALPGDADGR
jgi:hypothetical protein